MSRLPGPNPLPQMRVDSVSDGELRRAVIADIDRLFKASDFDTLEKLAIVNRASKKRTPAALTTWTFSTPFLIDVKLDASAFESGLAKARTYRFKYPKSPTP